MLWRRISAPVSWVVVFALGERGRRLFEVDPVDLDPAAAGLHERAGLPGELRHLGRGELDVVEEHRPGDVAELVRPDHRAGRRLGEQSQRRRRLAPRQRRHPHVEPDGGEGGTDDGHELPRLVLAQRDLAATLHARSVEGGEEPTESRPLGGHRSAAALGPQRSVDRDRLDPWRTARGPTRSQTPPGPGASSCTTSLGRDGDVTVRVQCLECPRHVSPRARPGLGTVSRPCGRSTRRSTSVADVHASVAAAGSSMRSTLSVTIASTTAVITADVDRRAVAAVDRRHRPRHRRGERGDHRAVRRAPAATGPSASTSRLWGRCGTRRARHDRPGRRQANPFERDVAEPEHARRRRRPGRGHRPPRRAIRAHPSPGSRARRLACHRGAATPGWSCQPNGGPPIASSRVDSSSCDSGGRATTRRPHHDLTRRPRGLELHLARLDLVAVASARSFAARASRA